MPDPNTCIMINPNFLCNLTLILTFGFIGALSPVGRILPKLARMLILALYPFWILCALVFFYLGQYIPNSSAIPSDCPSVVYPLGK